MSAIRAGIVAADVAAFGIGWFWPEIRGWFR